MKIISKFRDYYDFEVAHFGYDDSRVFDRRNADKVHNLNEDGRFIFHICGEKYTVIRKYGNCFHSNVTAKGFYDFHESTGLDNDDYWFLRDTWSLTDRKPKTDVNWKKGMPVLVQFRHCEEFYIPELQKFDFARHIPSEEMYQKIYDYLGWMKDNPPIPDNQTSKEKIVSHGFDVKTSFRPKMKG